MKIRDVKTDDIPEIVALYRIVFPNAKMNEEYYNYWYKNNKSYYSKLIEIEGKIIGHSALIKREYQYEGETKSFRLCSGGFILSEYSGLFYPLLKVFLKKYKEESIIGFPNQNSAPFFLKIFKFNEIKQNFFSLNKEDFFNPSLQSCHTKFVRTEDFITQRLINHPFNKYEIVRHVKNRLFYKKYRQDEADIIYVDYFDETFISLIRELFERGFLKLNIVHWNQEYITALNFKPVASNTFVYLNTNGGFECQMIDSDVF